MHDVMHPPTLIFCIFIAVSNAIYMSASWNVVVTKCPKTKGGIGKFIRPASNENSREW